MNSGWAQTSRELPTLGTAVLISVYGNIHVAKLKSGAGSEGEFHYFEDAYNDNLHWEFCEVTAWHPMITYTKE